MMIGFNVIYSTAITFAKLSIIVSYWRIFPYPNFRNILRVTTAVVIGLWIASVPVTIFQCTPVESAWDINVQPEHCINFVAFMYVSTTSYIITDIVLVLAPFPYFCHLDISTRQKAVLGFLFFIGGL
jgi:hypothetical protein